MTSARLLVAMGLLLLTATELRAGDPLLETVLLPALDASGNTVRGHVIDSLTELPVADVEVTLWLHHARQPPTPLLRVRGDDEGWFTLLENVRCEPSRLRITARASGYLPWQSHGHRLTSVMDPIRLHRGVPVTGRVLLPNGEPARRARVTVVQGGQTSGIGRGRLSNAKHDDRHQTVTVDGDGRFTVSSQGDRVIFLFGLDGRASAAWFHHDLSRNRPVELPDVQLAAGRSLRVKVVDEGQRPLAGVRVQADFEVPIHAIDEPRRGQFAPGSVLDSRAAVTGADGSITLHGLEDRVLFLAVRDEAWEGKPLIDLEVGDRMLQLQVVPTLRLRARIVDASGSPIRVPAVSIQHSSQFTGPRLYPDGDSYLSAPLTAGQSTARIHVPGHAALQVDWEQDLGIVDLGVLTLPATESCTIRVVDARGAPVSGALVNLTDEPGRYPVRTDLSGRCRLLASAGEHGVVVWKNPDVHIEVPSVTFPAAEEVVLRSPSRSRLEVRVLDAAGAPASRYTSIDVRRAAQPDEPVRTGNLNYLGWAGLGPLPTDEKLLLVIRDTGGRHETLKIEIDPLREGELRTLPPVTLSAGLTVDVVVRSPEGQPLRNIRVFAKPANATSRADQRRATTDEQGRAVLTRLAETTYVLRMDPDERRSTTEVTVTGEPMAPIELVALTRVHLTITVLDAEGAPVESGEAVLAPIDGQRRERTLKIVDGKLRLMSLDRQQTYALTLHLPDRMPLSFQGMASELPREVRVPPGADLRVRVIEFGTATPITAFKVIIQGELVLPGFDGALRLRDVPPGSWRVRAEAPGYEKAPEREVEIGTGGEHELVFELTRPQAVQVLALQMVHVRNDDGPVAGAQVWLPGQHTVTDAAGVARFPRPPSRETGLIAVRAPGHQDHRELLRREVLQGTRHDVWLHAIVHHTVAIHFEDPLGMPPVGLRARLMSHPKVGSPAHRSPAHGGSDLQGDVVFRETLPGTYWLNYSWGSLRGHRVIEVGPDSTTRLSISLRPVTLTGRVLHEGAAVIEGSVRVARISDPSPHATASGRVARIRDGAFETSLLPGEYQIWAEFEFGNERWAAYDQRVIDEATTCVLHLHRAGFRGSIERPGATPRKIRYQLRPVGPATAWRRAQEYVYESDRAGGVELPELPPGDYWWSVLSAPHSVYGLVKRVRVPSGQVERYQLPLLQEVRLRLPQATESTWIARATDDGGLVTIARFEGSFDTVLLPEGTHRLLIRASQGNDSAIGWSTLQVGPANAVHTPELMPAASLVLDHGGQQLGGLELRIVSLTAEGQPDLVDIVPSPGGETRIVLAPGRYRWQVWREGSHMIGGEISLAPGQSEAVALHRHFAPQPLTENTGVRSWKLRVVVPADLLASDRAPFALESAWILHRGELEFEPLDVSRNRRAPTRRALCLRLEDPHQRISFQGTAVEVGTGNEIAIPDSKQSTELIILRADGDPVPGARVSHRQWTLTTDARGAVYWPRNAILEDSPLRIDAPGYPVSQVDLYRARRGARGNQVQHRLARGREFRVFIDASRLDEIPDLEVTARHRGGPRRAGVFQETRGSWHSFEIPQLGPGTVTVKIIQEGTVVATYTLELETDTLAELVHRLAPSLEITGRMLANGEPFVDGELILSPPDRSHVRRIALAEDGRFRVRLARAGTYKFHFSRRTPHYLAQSFTRLIDVPQDITFNVSTVPLSLHCVDAAGQGVARSVVVTQVSKAGVTATWRSRGLRTNAQGRLNVDGVPPGPYRIAFPQWRREGFYHPGEKVLVTANSHDFRIELARVRPCRVVLPETSTTNALEMSLRIDGDEVRLGRRPLPRFEVEVPEIQGYLHGHARGLLLRPISFAALHKNRETRAELWPCGKVTLIAGGRRSARPTVILEARGSAEIPRWWREHFLHTVELGQQVLLPPGEYRVRRSTGEEWKEFEVEKGGTTQVEPL